eukprot:scaffold32295_cov67-Skeletonema_dohrnii-CCMP3373.AAC.1
MNSKFNSVLSAKVRNLEKKQQAEMAALTKKIETKRREVTKKRKEDTLRLQQRNRNIVKMLDAKNYFDVYSTLHYLFHSSSTSPCARNWSAQKLPQISNCV